MANNDDTQWCVRKIHHCVPLIQRFNTYAIKENVLKRWIIGK